MAKTSQTYMQSNRLLPHWQWRGRLKQWRSGHPWRRPISLAAQKSKKFIAWRDAVQSCGLACRLSAFGALGKACSGLLQHNCKKLHLENIKASSSLQVCFGSKIERIQCMHPPRHHVERLQEAPPPATT
jgi:hypothetical protein